MKTAIITASYRADFQRCALLCESIDRHVTGYTDHFILVEKADVALFAQLSGPRRTIVDERAILPGWLRVFPDPASFGRRRIWLTPKGPPLRGWHVQQLRKIAMAAIAREDGVLLCDSDTVFIRPTDLAELWDGDAFAFYALPGAIGAHTPGHASWSRRAGDLLGLPREAVSTTDYIAQSVGWRTDSVREMLRRIESVTGRQWAAALAGNRKLSECMIYGRFVEEIEGRPDRHIASSTPLCLTQWGGKPMDEMSLRRFVQRAGPRQSAVGFQSFMGTDLDMIRRATGLT